MHGHLLIGVADGCWALLLMAHYAREMVRPAKDES